jgi:WD40 repeat protein
MPGSVRAQGNQRYLSGLASAAPGLRVVLLIPFLLCFMLLPGCSSTTPSPAPTGTQSPEPSATPEPSPTSMVTIQSLPEATATIAADVIPENTATPIPEGSLFLAHIIQYPVNELVHALLWSPDGAWLAVSAGETVYLYDGLSLEPRHALNAEAWASGLAFAPVDKMLALAARDGTLQFWDIEQGVRLTSFFAHQKGANSLSFSPDGLLLASAGNDAILRVWDVAAILNQAEPEPVSDMIGGAFAVPVVRFNPQGTLLASVDLKYIRLRDPATTRLVRSLLSEASVFRIVFSPDGRNLAAAETDNTLRIWEVETGTEAGELQLAGPIGFLWDVAFGQDGSLVGAVSSGGQAAIWSFPSGETLAEFQAHERAASAIAFSPDGQWVATGGLDAVVRFWQLADVR